MEEPSASDTPTPSATEAAATTATTSTQSDPSLKAQSKTFLKLLKQAKIVRVFRVVIGIAISLAVFLGAGLIPLVVQRSLNYFDTLGIGSEGLAANVFTAISLTLLAQASLVFLFSTLISFSVAELFIPPSANEDRRPRIELWRSLHRLGNATSITLVCVVASAAVAIGIFGSFLHRDGMPDSPGELAAIQLGTLLFVLTVAMVYESVRYTYSILTRLPPFYRGLAGLLLPMAAAYLVNFLIPVGTLFLNILMQWTTPIQTGVIQNLGVSDLYDQSWGIFGPGLLVLATWVLHFLSLGRLRDLLPKRLRAMLPTRHKHDPSILNP